MNREAFSTRISLNSAGRQQAPNRGAVTVTQHPHASFVLGAHQLFLPEITSTHGSRRDPISDSDL